MEIVNIWDEQYIPPNIILGIVEILPPDMLLTVFVKSYKKSGDYKDTSQSGIRAICSLKDFNEREQYLSHMINRLSANRDLLIRLVTDYAPFFLNSNEADFKDKVCKLVFNNLGQEIINKVAIETKCPEFIKHCNDNAILDKLALDEKTSSLVIDRLQSSDLLEKIALSDPDRQNRSMAIAKINNQSVLEQIALKDSNEFVRRDAVYKITNSSVLADIAKNDKEIFVRVAAIQNINMIDQTLIIELIKNYYIMSNNNVIDRDTELLELIPRLTDISILLHIVENKKEYSEFIRYETAKIALAESDEPELQAEMRKVLVNIDTDRKERAERADWAQRNAEWNR